MLASQHPWSWTSAWPLREWSCRRSWSLAWVDPRLDLGVRHKSTRSLPMWNDTPVPFRQISQKDWVSMEMWKSMVPSWMGTNTKRHPTQFLVQGSYFVLVHLFLQVCADVYASLDTCTLTLSYPYKQRTALTLGGICQTWQQQPDPWPQLCARRQTIDHWSVLPLSSVTLLYVDVN